MLIGLVGKPSCGKSTFFKAATLAEVAIAPYPFTTIEANEGAGYVRVKCPETEIPSLKGKTCSPQHGFCLKGNRFVPIKLIDVAGLVPEAHKGKGRGNQFLDDLSEADLLIHVLDASGETDAEGNPAEDYAVEKDAEFLVNEIDMWIFGILEKNWNSLVRKSQTQHSNISSELANQLSGLKIKEDDVKSAMKKLELSERADAWKKEDVLEFAKKIREQSKPIIISANKSDKKSARENIKKLKERFPETLIIPCSAESELALREAAKVELIDYIPGDKDFRIKGELNNKQKHALEIIKKDVLDVYGSTGIQDTLNEAVFNYLKCIAVFPVENEHHFSSKKGDVLPDAHLLPKDATALDLAYAIHSDIGGNFSAAIDARTGKKLGKNAELKDKDIVKIMAKT